MNSLMQFWQDWGGWLVAGLLLAISLGFILRFALPALALGQELAGAVRALTSLVAGKALADPARIGQEIMHTPRLAHLWREYSQTLHAVMDSRNPQAVAAWRATAMAEDFFTERALVDTPLKTEFYKHLPGILTGIGIIGTFTGLIAGLSHFEVSSNAESVRSSLRGLIQGVGHAFQVSAAAITLAMMATWVEKSLVTRRYRQVDQLSQLIDSLFDAGVGEEYLARLVRASEASAAQSARLQQAIVVELRQSMEKMLAQQQEIALRQQELMATRVAEAVAKTMGGALQEPLRRMSTALEKLEAGQGHTLGGALEAALSQFSDRLDGTFGQRQDGLESLLQRTAASLESVVAELGRMAGRLEQAGCGAVELAAGSLSQAGRGVGDAAEAFAITTTDLAASAGAMAQAAKAIGQALGEQNEASSAIARLVADLRDIAGLVRREASLTSNLVARIEEAAATLGRAGRDAEEYLQQVSQVLGEAHAAFADNVEKTLARGNGQFQGQVAAAMELLKGAIEELSDALQPETGRR